MSNQIEEKIKRLIVEALNLDINPSEIGDSDLLFGGQLGFDSLAALSLIVGLETEFGITILDEDIGLELFRSVQAIADYVRRQLSQG